MNKFLRFSILFLLIVFFSNQSYGTTTWYHNSTCTVKTDDSSMGLVYITDNEKSKPSSLNDCNESMSCHIQTNKPSPSSTDGGNATHVYYLHAMAQEGYRFDHWEGKSNESANPYTFSWTHSTSTTDSDPNIGGISTTWTAFFVPDNDVMKETNIPAGTITLNPAAPHVGDVVTATTSVNPIHDVNGNPAHSSNKNVMVEFDHWEMWVNDAKVKDLGDTETIEFTVEEPMTLKAIFKDLGEIPSPGKYYRVRNAWNRVLTIEGGYSVTLNNASAIDKALLRWALPLDHNYDDFHTGASNNEWIVSDLYEPINPEAHPGTVFYVADGNFDNKNNPTALTSATLSAQGADTKTLTKQTLTVVNMASNFPGYRGVKTFAAGQEVGFKTTTRPIDGQNECVVFVAGFQDSGIDCALAVQPIDEDHIDYFWFGANADEDMIFEDGYWTSLYTVFPYRIYEEDGVEAYYVTTETTQANGTTYLVLKEVEDGIIPAKSAVLLKCKESNNTKANRLLPLSPDDALVKGKTLTGNILKGEFQLYSSSSKAGRVNFSGDKMRVLGVNNNGEVGFYKLSEGTELKANKAYLDMTQLSSEVSTASFKLAPKDFTTGIEIIEEDGSSIRIEDNTVYDLMGRRVVHPQTGTIYIINGKKVIWK